jgi:hypothetical protein
MPTPSARRSSRRAGAAMSARRARVLVISSHSSRKSPVVCARKASVKAGDDGDCDMGKGADDDSSDRVHLALR